MKSLFPRFLAALFCFVFAAVAFADDFKSVTIVGGPSASLGPIRVHGDQFMVIRNFTQDTGTTERGAVMVSAPPSSTAVNVLAAAILSMSPLDVINSVVIAGPADVTVTCPDASANCFISYKKDSN